MFVEVLRLNQEERRDILQEKQNGLFCTDEGLCPKRLYIF